MPDKATEVALDAQGEEFKDGGKRQVEKLSEKQDGQDVFMEVSATVKTGRKFTIEYLTEKIARYEVALEKMRTLKAEAEKING